MDEGHSKAGDVVVTLEGTAEAKAFRWEPPLRKLNPLH